jgi:hypothetical protein
MRFSAALGFFRKLFCMILGGRLHYFKLLTESVKIDFDALKDVVVKIGTLSTHQTTSKGCSGTGYSKR